MRHVHKFPHGDGGKCWLFLSFGYQPDSLGGVTLDPTITFAYVGENVAAEWEPKHGPIQVFNRANGPGDGIKAHHLYPWVRDEPLNWSQMAVEDEHLKEKVLGMNLDAVFDVLETWADAGNEE